jgi:hypothetical protein
MLGVGWKSERGRRAAAVVLFLVGCVFATLWPFRFALPLSWNRALPAPDGGVAFPAPGIVYGNRPGPSIDAAIRGNRLRILVQARPFVRNQVGPARILSLSWDPYLRNLTLGQDGDSLVLRLRTPATDENGMPELRIPNTLSPERWTEARISIEPGRLVVDLGAGRRVERPLPAEPLSVWDRRYPVLLGNERTGERPWLGEIRRALVETPAGAVDYADPAAHARPRILWHLHNGHRLNPLDGVSPVDGVLNVLGFVPLGLALGFGRRAWRWGAAVGAAAALSAVVELAQFLVPGRVPQTSDVFLNTLGAACGLLLARRLTVVPSGFTRQAPAAEPVSGPGPGTVGPPGRQ